jgi:hypothetical protein
VLEGSQGAVAMIVISNSPADVEFSIRDERFIAIIVPTDQGNMIFLGEKDKDLYQFASMFSENVEWIF